MTEVDPGRRLLISVAVMSATVMQVLDTTIVNVALPHMQGTLSATPDQISWVLTSYLVASGIFMPLTGYFTDRLGQRQYLLFSIAGFVIASGLCGISTNLTEIVTFRLLQGVFGAALVPLSQSIMVQTFPQNERGRAMAIWGIGVMVGPILGPTLGGYLTDALNWRWTFFVNLPVGVLSLLLAWRLVPDTAKRPRSMDFVGLIFMATAIGALQLTLDRGNQEDWFGSRLIQVSAILSVLGFAALIVHSLSHKHPIFRLRVFRDRNFSTSSLLLGMFGLGLFGAMMLQPLFLESLLGYPTATTGWLMAPRGVASMISMMIVGRLITRVEPRALVTTGVILCAIGSYAMTRYTLDISIFWLVWPIIVQGFGLGLIFVPLSTIAFATLPKADSAEAAGLYSLVRTIGSSIGISIAATVMTRHTQMAWQELGAHVQPYNPALPAYLHGLSVNGIDARTLGIVASEVGRQATMIGMLDAFTLILWSFVIMLPMVLLLKRGHHRSAGAPALE